MGSDGLPVLLRGVTWPGFDSGTGLNNLQVNALAACTSFYFSSAPASKTKSEDCGACVQGSSSITADFSTQVQRLKALGFNAVKLPFSFKTLLSSAAASAVPTTCATATPAQLQVIRSLSLLPASFPHLNVEQPRKYQMQQYYQMPFVEPLCKCTADSYKESGNSLPAV